MTSLIESLAPPPIELRFGTSGLRGLAIDMTDLECYINTQGFLAFLTGSNQLKPGSTIYVGGDLRDSTPRIAAATLQAILDAGYSPRFCGFVPTPALALYALKEAVPCIMISGSHIPSDRNGIKCYKPDGEVLKSDESAILAAVAMIRQRIYHQEAARSPFTASGQLRVPPALQPEPWQSEVLKTYRQRYSSFFEPGLLRDRTVVVYQHSSVARDLLVTVLEQSHRPSRSRR